MSYDWMNQVKQQLYDIGRPLTFQEASNLPHNVYLINKNGTPVSTDLRQQLKSAMGTEDAQRVHDGIEGMDNAELESNLKSYWDAFAIDPNHLPAGFNPTQIADLRVVPKSVVHAILRPITGSENPIGKAWDVGTTVARMATIYANVPGYMIANATGNLGFLLAQQPFRFPMLLNDARRLRNNRPLYDRIQAETGEVPLLAQIERGRGFSKKLAKGERRLLQFESVVDRAPRAMAWMHEARKRGYRSDKQMMELLEGKTPKTLRDREIVADRGTNHMVDFNRLTPHERQVFTRALFVWPWVRGATAYPFWYAKNYPLRAAAAANLGLAEQQRQKQMLGPLPPWYQTLYPISRKGDQAQVINTSPISPTSTAGSSLQLIEDTVASALGQKPTRQTAALVGSFNPLLKDAVSLATHKDQYGQDQSLQKILGGTIVDIVPGWRLVKALRDGSSTPRAFMKYDRGAQDRTVRTFVRIAPQTVTVPWLNAQAYSAGQLSTSEKITKAVDAEHSAWNTIGKGKPFPNFLRRSATMKVVYTDRLALLAKQKQGQPDFVPTFSASGAPNFTYQPTPYEQAKVLYAVVKQYYPGATAPQNGKPPQLPPPERVLAAYARDPNVGFVPKPDSPAGRLVMNHYLTRVEDAFFGIGSKAVSNAAKKIQAGKIEKQKNAPAAVKRRAQLAATP